MTMGIMTAGDHACAGSAGRRPAAASPPEADSFLIVRPDGASRTGLILFPRPDATGHRCSGRRAAPATARGPASGPRTPSPASRLATEIEAVSGGGWFES